MNLKESAVSDILFWPGTCAKTILITALSRAAVVEAYCKSVQGFFVKADDYEVLQKRLKLIVDYWKEALLPSSTIYY
jgi:hypothetical protein